MGREKRTSAPSLSDVLMSRHHHIAERGCTRSLLTSHHARLLPSRSYFRHYPRWDATELPQHASFRPGVTESEGSSDRAQRPP